ncbi:hypothetical protein [Rhizobium leguminosarum]|uniref:hypothetical protein n=1 Tax=Rhizobium leguminosarum TaxID=384 RepID=UPI00143F6B45|nr:hypothetical protein [Rhizobium leguminosarum]NKL23694.1 hypothetical protein [Rhizobium leguminosarum bv. viciae]
MMAQYPFNIDISTLDGQLEVLRLWSRTDVNISTASQILKMPTADVLDLARRHGIDPPSQDAVDESIKALEERIRLQLRKAKHDLVERQLSSAQSLVADALDSIASVALEANAYGQPTSRQSYSVAHARLRRALDALSSTREQFEKARQLEQKDAEDIEYNETSLVVLRNLDRVVPRPDYYLIGDFNHVDPVTEHDILWCWSKGFLNTENAVGMLLALEEGDTIDEIAAQHGIPLPSEKALHPLEAAAILGDRPVNGDVTFNVRRRIRDGRLASYFPSDVEARRSFEASLKDGS